MTWVTNFGDVAVIFPMAAAICFWLLWDQKKEICFLWVAIFAGSVCSILLLKALFFARPYAIGRFMLHSPSGHACLSATLYGGAAIFFFYGFRAKTRFVFVGAMAAIVA